MSIHNLSRNCHVLVPNNLVLSTYSTCCASYCMLYVYNEMSHIFSTFLQMFEYTKCESDVETSCGTYRERIADECLLVMRSCDVT